MNYLIYTQRIGYLKEMIEKGRLTSPQDAAKRFNCNERTIRRMIQILREQGCNIKYCRKNMRYFLKS